jgi:hypothetical protein
MGNSQIGRPLKSCKAFAFYPSCESKFSLVAPLHKTFHNRVLAGALKRMASLLPSTAVTLPLLNVWPWVGWQEAVDGRVKPGHDAERLQRKTPRHDLVERIRANVRERRCVQSRFLRGFEARAAIGACHGFGDTWL